MAAPQKFSNLDLINQVDSFPNASTHPALHAAALQPLTPFTHSTYTLGYLLPPVVAALRNAALSGAHWRFSGASSVELEGSTTGERTENIRRTAEAWRAAGTFQVLRGWRDELYTVYAPAGEELFRVERSAAALFGVVTYGVHLTTYTHSPTTGALHIWTPRRNPQKQTYGGLLDNTVAGGMSSGMTPFETLLKESEEEASFPPDLIEKRAKAAGAVSYFYVREKRAGGEVGLLMPEVEYVYDLRLEEGGEVVPRPGDGEVAEFRLWGVEKIQEELALGNFKPNCALVLIDFFIRHGIITPDNEPDYIEITTRLHRRFEFPTR